ncbi:hypothetical protein HID58_071517 [Brassica napus]|uniref:Uncharacterized protein n=1 Tax=Brassica napus TaxID=3708 RepID=A0ABQ7Z1T9_BRANA|nr:hypothetical protein HID58_071517 [Brassica napus]
MLDGFEREKACVFKLRHKNLNRPVEKILETYAQFFIDCVMEKKIRSGYRSCRRLEMKPTHGDETYSSKRVVDENMKIEERTLEKIKQVITLGLMFTDKSPSKQIKLLRRFMTWCFFV